MLLFSAALLYLYFNKENLSREVLAELNASQNGEVTVEKISLSLFKQFPRFSIKLGDLAFYDKSGLNRKNDEEAFCRIKSAFVSFNLIDLFNGDINISKVTLNNGYFRIITYKDSTTNLYHAFNTAPDSTGYKKTETLQLTEKSNNLETQEEPQHLLTIDDLVINGVTLESENYLLKRKSSILIENLKVSFKHKNNMNSIVLDSDLKLNYFTQNNRTFLKNDLISMATNLTYDENKELITVETSNIKFNGATFDLAGLFNIDDGDLDIKIHGSDKNFSMLSLFIKEVFLNKNRNNLTRGSYYFNGIVKGNIYNSFPYIELSLGAKDVDLYISSVDKSIKDLNFSAYLTTGLKKDFSEAYIKLENLTAQLPAGYTSGSLFVKDITNPKVKFKWYLKTDLTGFEDVVKIDPIDSLSGIITIDTDIDGVFSFDKGRILEDKNYAKIDLENVSLIIPDAISLDKVTGTVERKNDNFIIDSLKASIWGTDILLHAEFNKLLSVLFNIETDLSAKIHLESKKFDLPKVFSFDPSIGTSFNHIINNMDLLIEAKSTTSRVLEFDSFPAIDFHIKSLFAQFDDFPDIKIVNSNLSFFDDMTGFNIRFNPLNIYGANGFVSLNGAYNGSAWKPYYLLSDTKSDNIDMLDLLNQFNMDLDSTSFFNVIIDGSFSFKLEFPKDSLIFKTLKLANADLLIYDRAEDDTIITKSLTTEFKDVYYNLDVDPNPMATLTTHGFYQFNKLKNVTFEVEDVHHEVTVKNGLYEIIPRSKSYFGGDGNGVFVARPWSKSPNYHLEYSIENFDIQDFLESFFQDSLLTGKMNLHVDLKMIGDNWNSIRSKLNGTINFEGNNLLLSGLDVDELLKKIERSQNFTLIDVGAVLLTGPVGLAVTKGADVAILITTGTGKATHIQRFVSDWEIKNGLVMTKDVALSTNKNRLAAKGLINLSDETLDIIFGVLKEDGSLRFSQEIYGKIDDPELRKIDVLSTVFSPVTNLFNSVLQIKGDVFYDGSVKQPLSKKPTILEEVNTALTE